MKLLMDICTHIYGGGKNYVMKKATIHVVYVYEGKHRNLVNLKVCIFIKRYPKYSILH